MLLESYRDEAGFRRRLEQFGMCVQCPGGDMVGHTPFRESCWIGSKLSRCLHQFGKCIKGGKDF